MSRREMCIQSVEKKGQLHHQAAHSLIRGVLIQSSSAGAKKFANYVFCHPQFSSITQNIENHCAILTPGPVCLCQLLSK